MSARHPFADGHAPDWAEAWGVDEHGAFADFEVAGVVQRMRWIKPGTFSMGSPPDEPGRYDDEGPQHEVRLTEGVWLADTPVTQALWGAVMEGDNPARFAGEPGATELQRPVEQVSWDDAVAFCARLSERVPSTHPFRLPSEAEWERACRADTTAGTWRGELDSTHSVSTVLEPIAWYDENSGKTQGEGTTHPVAAKEPNPWGLYDMLGNVYEWCLDAWTGDYSEAGTDDPLHEDEAASDRVFRGGSWSSIALRCRAAYRNGDPRGIRWSNLGFRLARGPKPLGGARQQAGSGATAGDRSEAPMAGRAEPPEPGLETGDGGRDEAAAHLEVVLLPDVQVNASLVGLLAAFLAGLGVTWRLVPLVEEPSAGQVPAHRVVVGSLDGDLVPVVATWLDAELFEPPLHHVAVAGDGERGSPFVASWVWPDDRALLAHALRGRLDEGAPGAEETDEDRLATAALDLHRATEPMHSLSAEHWALLWADEALREALLAQGSDVLVHDDTDDEAWVAVFRDLRPAIGPTPSRRLLAERVARRPHLIADLPLEWADLLSAEGTAAQVDLTLEHLSAVGHDAPHGATVLPAALVAAVHLPEASDVTAESAMHHAAAWLEFSSEGTMIRTQVSLLAANLLHRLSGEWPRCLVRWTQPVVFNPSDSIIDGHTLALDGLESADRPNAGPGLVLCAARWAWMGEQRYEYDALVALELQGGPQQRPYVTTLSRDAVSPPTLHLPFAMVSPAAKPPLMYRSMSLSYMSDRTWRIAFFPEPAVPKLERLWG